MFAQGKGTKKDLASAYVWIAAAALQGDSRGESVLATLESQLGQEQLAEAREQAQFLAKSDKKSAELAFIH
jgi:TPR repeat protein